ncbi:uncharacterized protein LOC120980340 [Bufo bufo]|uniref:uncharacterized protein LOC120980340 n=1 Tax=Bufo bufo TaxID=8384 RepID=UPI001ABEC567|nr:uncharacterized protein LOC120980340 [Bufo bufo]
MKVPLLLVLVLSMAVAHAQVLDWIAGAGRKIKDGARFVKEAGQGSWDMARAYKDMRDANWKNSDKYFHARGNYDAAQRGSGGEWAARVISDARESIQTSGSGRGAEDSAADQRANEWGRSGRDPNHYRPKDLPDKYKRTSRQIPMKVPLLLVLVLSMAVAHAQVLDWLEDTGRKIKDGARFVKEAGQGSWDMARAYNDMRDANWKNSDKYFHARGNYDAAQRGCGGEWAARFISDAREFIQTSSSGGGAEDSAADQRANEWGRSGRDPNHYRPKGLPDKY